MSFAGLIARMKRYDKNAEVIFDREEPIGQPTDLVMPRRRWFRRKNRKVEKPTTPSLHHSIRP